MNTLLLFAQTSESLFGESSAAQTTMDVAAILSIVFAFLFFALLISVGAYIFGAICLMRIFKKAGIEQPWAAWVPVYNTWKTLEIGGQQGFWAVLMLVPIVNIVSIVYVYIALYNIGLKLGKSGSFILLALFLSPVWYIWLAFDSSTWDESAGAPSLTDVGRQNAANHQATPPAQPYEQ